MKQTKLLALDISTKSLGWAFGDGTVEHTVSGVKSFSEHNSDYGMLFSKYREWLMEAIKKHNPDMIVIEGTNSMLKGNARYLLLNMNGITHSVGWACGLPRKEFAPMSIKKFLTDNGRASKEEMISEIKKRGFKNIEIDDEADAIAILLLGISRMDE